MDSSQYSCSYGINLPTQYQNNQQYSTVPPWRTSSKNSQTEKANGQRGKTQHTQVDSWRSYKDDTVNLQSSAYPTSTLNAAAPDFQPTQNASYYKPYEPLRTSDGSKERKLVEQVNRAGRKTGSTSRFSAKSNHNQADQPVTSIEGNGLDYFLRNNALNNSLRSLQNDRYRQASPRARTPRQTASPAPPNTTDIYRSQAQKEPVKVTDARKLLVILDLNGTLLYRSKTPPRKVHMRPGVTPFLDYLFANHVVMVYTSTMPDTARDMVSQFLHPTQRNKLAALWARDKLDLNPEQYHNKVQVYKKLDKIWADKQIQATAGAGEEWDQSNTILIDDSKLKALAQPHNLLQVLEYTKEDDPSKGKGKGKNKDIVNQRHKVQVDILKQLEMKLEELKHQEDVSRLILRWQTGEISVPKFPGQMVSVEENVDQKRVQPQKEFQEISDPESTGRSQLPTPVSVRDGDTDERPLDISDDSDDGGMPLSGITSKTAIRPAPVVQIPGLDMLSDHTEDGRDRQKSESSLDEETFQQLLRGSRK